jgi:Ca-activated chloride channel family protein
VILLTDGRNNTGALAPLPVSKAAGLLGLRIHVVGLGGGGGEDPLDESLLRAVAREGGGRYLRARDREGFEEVMRELDQLEKGALPREAGLATRSRHGGLLLAGALLLVLEALLWLVPGRRIL